MPRPAFSFAGGWIAGSSLATLLPANGRGRESFTAEMNNSQPTPSALLQAEYGNLSWVAMAQLQRKKESCYG